MAQQMDKDEFGQPVYLSTKDFNDKYWYTPLQMVTVINPTDRDFPFMVEMRNYMIRAGATERFPGVIANVYLEQMAGIMAQDDDNFGHMSDPTLKAQYYEKLIVDIESLVEDYNPTPEYLQPKDETQEKPFAQLKKEVPKEEPEVPNEETKEFEQDGSRYKMVTAKNGRALHYRNGQLIPVAEYNKAASLL